MMKIIYNCWLKEGLVDYLLSQEGITDANIIEDNLMDCINISGDLKPSIVAKFIDLFQENKYSTMFAFDKGKTKNTKKIIYNVKDMCCEYCHMHFIRELFDNENIVSVESNFSFDKPAFGIKYIVYYFDKIEEKEIIDYIQKSI